MIPFQPGQPGSIQAEAWRVVKIGPSGNSFQHSSGDIDCRYIMLCACSDCRSVVLLDSQNPGRLAVGTEGGVSEALLGR